MYTYPPFPFFRIDAGYLKADVSDNRSSEDNYPCPGGEKHLWPRPRERVKLRAPCVSLPTSSRPDLTTRDGN